jgi:DNA-binding transcriptional LysR family regulator
MRFDISDLRIFVNVVEGKSITRGAEMSHRAVASISARIKDMESDLQTPLLVREHNGVAPTEAGRKLLGYAYRLLREMQNMSDDMADYARRARGYVKLCCNSLTLQELLPDVVGDFLERHPAISLSIDDVVNDSVVRMVADGRAEVGIVAEPVDRMKLEISPFYSERYVMVLPTDWPDSEPRRARFADFLDYEFVGPGRGTWMNTQLQQHAIENGMSLKTRVHVRSFPMTCAFAARGLGIGIVPSLVAKRLQPQLRFRIAELDDEWAALNLVICTRRRAELSSDAAILVDYLTHRYQPS